MVCLFQIRVSSITTWGIIKKKRHINVEVLNMFIKLLFSISFPKFKTMKKFSGKQVFDDKILSLKNFEKKDQRMCKAVN